MSAPVAGKFQDHYVILGVEPTADPEAIQLAYTRLVQQYHPSNPDTGDEEKFDALNLAYEVLSQPDLRNEFDKLKGIGAANAAPKFTGLPFFSSMGRETGLRTALLSVLYDRRRQKPFTPSLSVRHVENIVSATLEELTFVLWYLKERKWVISDDKSSLQITAEGMDYLEKNPPSAALVMPLIKPSGLMDPVSTPAESEGADAGQTPYAETGAAEYLSAEEESVAENGADEYDFVSASTTLEDPQMRANLNRILSRGGE